MFVKLTSCPNHKSSQSYIAYCSASQIYASELEALRVVARTEEGSTIAPRVVQQLRIWGDSTYLQSSL